MSDVLAQYEDLLRIFRKEIDEHLHWQEAQEFYGLLTLEAGWKRQASTVFQELEKLRMSGKIPSPEFERALTDFFWLYVY